MHDERPGDGNGDSSAWSDLGSVEELSLRPLQMVQAGRTPLALVYRDGEWSALSGVCNHVAGPLGEGTLDGDYVVCPWHYWKFHRESGAGEPGYEEDRVPSHRLREHDGHLFVELQPATRRGRLPHAAHPLARPPQRLPGPPRVSR